MDRTVIVTYPQMTNSECSDNLDMLYLLASVAEKVSTDRLHALAAAAVSLKEARKSDVVSSSLT